MQMIKTMPDQSGADRSGQSQRYHPAGLPFKANPGRQLRVHAIINLSESPMSESPWHLKGIWPNIHLLFSRLAQSFRLMVGVRDYQAYLQHMHQHHPQQQAMTEKQFHRYCVDARYGGKTGKLGKCPC